MGDVRFGGASWATATGEIVISVMKAVETVTAAVNLVMTNSLMWWVTN